MTLASPLLLGGWPLSWLLLVLALLALLAYAVYRVAGAAGSGPDRLEFREK